MSLPLRPHKNPVSMQSRSLDRSVLVMSSPMLLLVFLLPTLAWGSPRVDLTGSSLDPRKNLVELIPQQSCYYQNYNQRLTCNCNSTDTAAYLHLRMKFYLIENEIREVHVQQCRELLVTLDLRDVDASKASIQFRQIRKVKIEKIMFEPRYSVEQELELVFDNVEELLFEDLFVEDTIKIRATNVKEAKFVRSTFRHIPPYGFQVSRAKLVDIRDSTFLRVKPKSIVVEKTSKVIVLMNEMTINAFEVVTATDGSYMMISCNRLRGQPVSPECSKTTTTTTTTTTTPRPPPLLDNQGNLIKGESVSEERDGEGIRSILPEILGGALGGVILILLVLIFFICLMKRRRREPEAVPAVEAHANGKSNVVEVEMSNGPAPPEDKSHEPEAGSPDEADALLEDEDDDKPRFSTPIWLDEIQKNKIFNRQKSLLSQEGLKNVAGDSRPEPIPEGSPILAHCSEDERIQESSRTESDEDFRDKMHHADEVDSARVKSPSDVKPEDVTRKEVHPQESVLSVEF